VIFTDPPRPIRYIRHRGAAAARSSSAPTPPHPAFPLCRQLNSPVPTPPSTTAAAFIEARRILDAFITTPGVIDAIDRWAVLLHQQFARGHKVLICGNGGSACDAAHFAEELTGRFRHDRAPLAAIACTDFGHITCTANDYGFDQVFSRWVQALGKPGDTLILLSTSGNSPNILAAAEAAKARGLATIALLGKDGGALAGRCDHQLIVPGDTSDRIQELHMLTLHILVEAVEALMQPE
jgi:D-sedoheptulose 7-phosphate isomerase